MGVSEVLLCPYRCLEYKMERLEKLKTHFRCTMHMRHASRNFGISSSEESIQDLWILHAYEYQRY